MLEYQESTRVISEQQRNITVSNEKIRVLEGLQTGERGKSVEITSTAAGDWEEVWEDRDDNSGNLVKQRRKEMNKYKSTPELACTICKKVFDSDHQMRQYIKGHKNTDSQMLKCHHCDFMTNDEEIHLNHVVDIHGTKHKCKTCGSVFPDYSKMVEHATNAHGFKYSETEGLKQDIECHDCEEKFSNKTELMQHKTIKHYKTRLCSYWHGNGWGCRFPASKCLNIHHENITPTLTNDIRSKILCKHGESCNFNKQNSCL